jgi:CheY-like chemotaxis protein
MAKSTYILVAEDDDAVRDVLCALLEEEGYRTVAARDGEEALALFHRLAVDLVLTDLQMPALGGHTLCRRLRALERGRRVPIIAMSAAAEHWPAEADAHLRKPFELTRLLDEVQLWAPLDRPRRQRVSGTFRTVTMPPEHTALILYVNGAGEKAATVAACRRLLARELDGGCATFEVVDASADRERVEHDRVTLTPMLVIRRGESTIRLVGDLDSPDARRVLASLGAA